MGGMGGMSGMGGMGGYSSDEDMGPRKRMGWFHIYKCIIIIIISISFS